MDSNLVKMTKLLSLLGKLGDAIKTGIPNSIDFQTKEIDKHMSDMVIDIPNKDRWRSYADPQEVFKDPESVHAFVKLQSSVATFNSAHYHNNTALTQAAYMTSVGYLNKVRSLSKLKPL